MAGRAHRGSLGLCVLGLTLATTGACSGGEADPTAPTAVVARVAEEDRKTNARFSFVADGPESFVAQGVIRVGTPPALRMSWFGTGASSEQPGGFEHVVLDGTVYARPFGVDDGGLREEFPWAGLVPAWTRSPLTAPEGFGGYLFTFGSPQDLDPRHFAHTLAMGTDLRADGQETIDGVTTDRYLGLVDPERLRTAEDADPDIRDKFLDDLSPAPADPELELWVDQEFRLRQFVVKAFHEGELSTLTVKLFDLGSDSPIEAPPAEDLEEQDAQPVAPTDPLLHARLDRRYGSSCGAELFERYGRGEPPPRVDDLSPCAS